MAVIAKTEDLEVFLAVVDCGGFSAAASLLDIQVAKVSRAISRLEKSVNCTLLNRTTRRVELTQEGQIYLQQIRQGLNQLEQAEEALRLLKNKPAGRLRVDAASPFVFHQLVPHMQAFSQQYPDIKIDLSSQDNVVDLLEYRTDVAIRIGNLQDSNLHARLLGRTRLHLVASPDYLNSAPTINQITDLCQQRLLGFSEPSTLNDWPLRETLKTKFAMTASSGETLRQLCLAGQGIALISYFVCQHDLQQGRLVEVLPDAIDSPNRREPVNAVYYRNSAVSSRILAFLDFIQPRLTL